MHNITPKIKAAVTTALANPLIDPPKLIADLHVIGVEVGVLTTDGAAGGGRANDTTTDS